MSFYSSVHTIGVSKELISPIEWSMISQFQTHCTIRKSLIISLISTQLIAWNKLTTSYVPCNGIQTHTLIAQKSFLTGFQGSTIIHIVGCLYNVIYCWNCAVLTATGTEGWVTPWELLAITCLTGVVPFSQNDGVTGLPLGMAGCSGCESIAWMLL